MKRCTLTAALAALTALPAFAALKPGDPAPAFQAEASKAGQAFGYSLQAELKKGPVVVYFYPSAFTNGCNLQAHSFAVEQEKFAAAGASIVGVSLDSIARLNDFSADPKYCAGKFPVASDPDGAIARSFGLAVMDAKPGAKDTRGQEIGHAFTERTTFVIAPGGKIAAVFSSAEDKIAPSDHAVKSLAAAQKLATPRPHPATH
jgi:thioredoxin-dependent peroxiredoxin